MDAAGAGSARWHGQTLTRWHDDPVGRAWGSHILLRDEDSGQAWSTTLQPCGGDGDDFVVDFEPALIRVRHRHNDIESVLEVAVDEGHDLELRRVELTNHDQRRRILSLTSYAEWVLGPAGADTPHPAFSKMFVQTRWEPEGGLLLATRRRHAQDEPHLWAGHMALVHGVDEDTTEFESSRLHFLGRGRPLRDAGAMRPGARLGGTCGCVLDPVLALRRHVALEPGASVVVSFWTAAGPSQEEVTRLLAGARDPDADRYVFERARDGAAALRRRLGIDEDQAARFDGLVGALLYVDPACRAPAEVIARGSGGAPVLWRVGVSGDRPIVLLHADDAQANDAGTLDDARQLLLAQRYWQARCLACDVVLLGHGKAHEALAELQAQQKAQLDEYADDCKAECFALDAHAIDKEVLDGLRAVARVELRARCAWPAATGKTQVAVGQARALSPFPRATTREAGDDHDASVREFDNGLGGFVDDGRSYAITLEGEDCTPRPWINVLANAEFGCLVSAEGSGYAWSVNSQQNAITPWSNDAVVDLPAEVIYLRDEDGGELWSATPAPVRVPSTRYTVVHGKGWTRHAHATHGIEVELMQCVPVQGTLKIARLRLRNPSAHARHLQVTAYVEWMLGANGASTGAYVVTSRDADGALLARNRWRDEFRERVAFIDFGTDAAASGDRREVLGRCGDAGRPDALIDGGTLSGRTGAGLEPCGALQRRVTLEAGGEVELRLLLGDAASQEEALALVQAYRHADVDDVLADLRRQWDDVLDTVQVSTPSRAMDIVLNHWLPYQVLGCRMWARTAFYQASGAYGFRDQLQDSMALCLSRPDLAREHLLRAAGRQFPEGDVQHWWLPPTGKGIRTRISDDRLWLAYVLAHYLEATGDEAVLDEDIAFIEGDAVKPGDTDAFYLPRESDETASLYEHAARAIDSSLVTGAHGLPLMGTGDWNDGMNNVGAKGKGESVWMGWFLVATIDACAPIAEARGEHERAQQWRRHAASLRKALDGDAGWDGAWYRRGYYDDGTVLGSRQDEECRIDVIAQSWSVLAGANDGEHAAAAMQAVDQHLVLHDERIALLLAPPFDHAQANPGYIKGYPPGIRENGGQYTHGATWSVFAWARLGDGARAMASFDMLNPLTHATDADAVARYRVEPYVSCADVYSVDPHMGCGGWTWYTGSAAWLYRAGVEAVLGLHVRGQRLYVEPCIPAHWKGYDMVYRRRGSGGHVTRYRIHVDNSAGVCSGVGSLVLDDQHQDAPANGVALVDDGAVHTLVVRLGEQAT